LNHSAQIDTLARPASVSSWISGMPLSASGPAPKGPVYLISLGLPNCRSQDVRYSAALGGSAEVEQIRTLAINCF
jgi:hypothetical protein